MTGSTLTMLWGFRNAYVVLVVVINAWVPTGINGQSSSTREKLNNGSEPAVCVSAGQGRPSFAREGKPPGRAQDLTFCQAYGKRTCCGKAQTDSILRRVYYMRDVVSADCTREWSTLECAICDPRLGTSKNPVICENFCNYVYAVCKGNFFSEDPTSSLLVPCASNDLLCARMDSWVPDGAAMCTLAGFAVSRTVGPHCFDGMNVLLSADDTAAKGSTRSSRQKASKWWSSSSPLDVADEGWDEDGDDSQRGWAGLWSRYGSLVFLVAAIILLFFLRYRTYSSKGYRRRGLRGYPPAKAMEEVRRQQQANYGSQR